MEKDDSISDVQSEVTLISGSLPAAVSGLLASSRGIPSGKDFHFFNNFEEFKIPLSQVASKSQSLLEAIGGSSEALYKQDLPFPRCRGELDFEEAYDWLVNVNDDMFERIDASLEEFQCVRNEEGELDGSMEDGGFQMVYGKKKKKKIVLNTEKSRVVWTADTSNNLAESSLTGSGVKVADHKKDIGGATKSKIPFHVPSIRRPQEEFSILVNNSSVPFQHVWLERSDDGSRVVHPLEMLSVSDFIDWNVTSSEPRLALPLEDTPLKFVENVKDLKQLVAKLREVSEFSVDLEHNHYRSFQGLTCLMQISTRDEDYIVDTLKLKIHLGPYLRDIFKNPSKRKVMHGADRDILWLQRDFGIYVCNLFDTGQASKIMKLERNSLEFLLQHFCGVTANKEYQAADWRLRPLPEEMIRYAREDTHFLLQIYDTMRQMLLAMPKANENADHPLLEVYKQSGAVCMQLYEKDCLTDSSYLHVYGLQGAGLSAEQLSIASGLFGWRDAVARAEDESTGYILPNKTLLDIAKQMPVTTSKLRRILKSKHPYVERSLGSIVDIINHALQNASAFEATAQSLKEAIIEKANSDSATGVKLVTSESSNVESVKIESDVNTQLSTAVESKHQLEPQGHFASSHGNEGAFIADKLADEKASRVTVQALKKPIGVFGALLGNSAAKRKSDASNKVQQGMTLEKIRTSFPSILGRNDVTMPLQQSSQDDQPSLVPQKCFQPPPISNTDDSTLPSPSEDIILLENASGTEPDNEDPEPINDFEDKELDDNEPISLSDLSDSFQKCMDSKKSKLQPPGPNFQPFDYSTAPRFWETPEEETKSGSTQKVPSGKAKSTPNKDHKGDGGTREFAAPRRRQAFPVTGNRSATFR